MYRWYFRKNFNSLCQPRHTSFSGTKGPSWKTVGIYTRQGGHSGRGFPLFVHLPNGKIYLQIYLQKICINKELLSNYRRSHHTPTYVAFVRRTHEEKNVDHVMWFKNYKCLQIDIKIDILLQEIFITFLRMINNWKVTGNNSIICAKVDNIIT